MDVLPASNHMKQNYINCTNTRENEAKRIHMTKKFKNATGNAALILIEIWVSRFLLWVSNHWVGSIRCDRESWQQRNSVETDMVAIDAGKQVKPVKIATMHASCSMSRLHLLIIEACKVGGIVQLPAYAVNCTGMLYVRRVSAPSILCQPSLRRGVPFSSDQRPVHGCKEHSESSCIIRLDHDS